MENTTAAPAKKKINPMLIYMGIGALILIFLIIWICVSMPFIFQQKAWLQANASKYWSSATFGKMTDAQITTAFKVINGYGGTIPTTDTATQTAWNGLLTAYPAGT